MAEISGMPSFGIFPNDLRYYHDWATQVMKLYLFSRRLAEIRDAKTKLEEQKSETNVKIQEVSKLLENNFAKKNRILDLNQGQNSLGEISKELDKRNTRCSIKCWNHPFHHKIKPLQI